jgi:hypothetical protein
MSDWVDADQEAVQTVRLAWQEDAAVLLPKTFTA